MKAPSCPRSAPLRRAAALLPLAFTCLLADGGAHAQQTTFTPGNLVVSVEGCGVYGGTCTVPNGTGTGAQNSNLGGYGDNQAGPLTLFQFAPVGTTAATYVNSLVLPQTASSPNLPVSAEYGSSSEASMHLSGNGQFLAILGYGVNAAFYNANVSQFGNAALAQSTSLTSSSLTAVPRVLALIDANGIVSSSTAVFNAFNTNNPRSVFTADGTSAYLSGQGASGDATGGLFYVPVGSIITSPTPITGLDTSDNTAAQDTRDVQILNNTLYASVDTKAGSGAARSFVGTVGTHGTLPTGTVGAPVMLRGFGNTGGTGQVTITTSADGSNNGNGINAVGQTVNLSPENFFFASPSVLYVADSGNGKQTSASTKLGDGGLQKWINSAADGSGTWTLAYTLYRGLNLVANTNTDGISGLYGLAGQVVNGQVQLYATSFTLADLDQTFLYGITDNLSYTTAGQAAGETFSTLASAPKGSNFKGVSFAPVAAITNPLNITTSLTKTAAGYQLNISVRNSGTTTTENVVLTSATLGSVSGSSLPINLGPLAAGQSATTTVAVPASAGPDKTAAVARIAGTYSGGTFGSSLRVTLP